MRHAYAELACGQVYYESEGKGEAVLCLHQVPWSSGEFLNIIPILGAEYKVLAPDMVGSGCSDPAPMDWKTVEDWVDYVIQFMDEQKIKKAHIIGSHFGAQLAVAVAAAYPKRVNKLVLFGCGARRKEAVPMYGPVESSLEVPVDASHIRELWNGIVANDKNGDPESVQRMFLDAMRAFDKRCDTGNANLPGDEGFDLLKKAKAVKSPTMLIVATNDYIRPPVYRSAESVAEYIPNCDIEYVDGAGMMGMKVCADAFSAGIRSFLQA